MLITFQNRSCSLPHTRIESRKIMPNIHMLRNIDLSKRNGFEVNIWVWRQYQSTMRYKEFSIYDKWGWNSVVKIIPIIESVGLFPSTGSYPILVLATTMSWKLTKYFGIRQNKQYATNQEGRWVSGKMVNFIFIL